MLRRFKYFGAVLLALGMVCPVASAAASAPDAGEIHLEVQDASGAALVAAGVLRTMNTGAERTFVTDAQGKAVFTGLAEGRYRLQLARAGFATQLVPVEVAAGKAVSRTVQLQLRSQSTTVEVVAVTPLAGSDLSRDQIPSPVQSVTAKDLENSGALDLSDLLNKRLNGVYLNENQGNPFQPDLNYRGYTASPLPGTPQGVSVYLDGVRQNQPFADIVTWDLIPKTAIQEATLIPGSDPLYGLNTLGGALSVETKDGLSHPGTSLQGTGGRFGRRAVEFEHGGANAHGWDWYVGGNLYREDGWRQDSPSEVRQVFGKLGWRRGKTRVTLSAGYADNWLTGNGLQDFRFLQRSYSSVYSIPDVTWNHSPSLTLNIRRDLAGDVTFSGLAYFRYIRSDTTNGDINSNSFNESLYNLSASDIAALNAAGYKGFPTTGNAQTEPFPYLRCIGQSLTNNEPIEKCTGMITDTWTKQNNYGLSGLVNWRKSRSHFALGAAWDRSSSTFQQSVQFAYLNPDRITFTPVPALQNGSTNSDGIPVDTRVYLHGVNNTPSVYATETYTWGQWNFTASGRFNRTGIQNIDRLPVAEGGGRGSLNGQYAFGRFNPAAGVTYSPAQWVSGYFSYTESSRAPSSIELGCANPNEPCNLPNALVSDPPLKQVVSRTLEAGIRGSQESNLRWSAGWFRGTNYDDLLFVASQQTGFGYFTNFGKTRRQGAEANVRGRVRGLTVGGGYTFLNATYESAQTIDAGSNSSNASAQMGVFGVDDNINLRPGDRIPLTPEHLLKTYADYQVTPKLNVDLDYLAVSRSFARGNENNLDKPDGVYYLGPGSSPGYGLVNLGGHYQVHRRVRMFVQVNNLLNHRYYTAAQLGPTPFDSHGNFVARPFGAIAGGDYPIRTTTFYAPGAPINVFGGLKFTF